MNADKVQTIINEAAKALPSHLALILTTECDVVIDEDGDIAVCGPEDVGNADFESIIEAIKTAAEHYQTPPTLH
jgi:hypothetical protein